MIPTSSGGPAITPDGQRRRPVQLARPPVQQRTVIRATLLCWCQANDQAGLQLDSHCPTEYEGQARREALPRLIQESQRVCVVASYLPPERLLRCLYLHVESEAGRSTRADIFLESISKAGFPSLRRSLRNGACTPELRDHSGRKSNKLKAQVESHPSPAKGGPPRFCASDYMYIHLLRHGTLRNTETTLHVRQLPPDFAGTDPAI